MPLDERATVLGTVLRTARLAKGDATLQTLARTLGVGQPFISKVERGHKVPSWELTEGWAMLLDIPVDDRLMRLWVASRQRMVFLMDGLTVPQAKLLVMLHRYVGTLSDEMSYGMIKQILKHQPSLEEAPSVPL